MSPTERQTHRLVSYLRTIDGQKWWTQRYDSLIRQR